MFFFQYFIILIWNNQILFSMDVSKGDEPYKSFLCYFYICIIFCCFSFLFLWYQNILFLRWDHYFLLGSTLWCSLVVLTFQTNTSNIYLEIWYVLLLIIFFTFNLFGQVRWHCWASTKFLHPLNQTLTNMKQKPGIAGDWHEPVMLLAKIPSQEGFKNGQKDGWLDCWWGSR